MTCFSDETFPTEKDYKHAHMNACPSQRQSPDGKLLKVLIYEAKKPNSSGQSWHLLSNSGSMPMLHAPEQTRLYSGLEEFDITTKAMTLDWMSEDEVNNIWQISAKYITTLVSNQN